MQVIALKYDLYLADFATIELEIQSLFKKELNKYNIHTYDSLPRGDYLKLIRYFTLSTLFKNYAELEHKKDTVFWINREICNTDILIFIKEIKKVFPILLYITNKPWDITLFNKKTAE